jgi:wobble nucleotide-excising tRNase
LKHHHLAKYDSTYRDLNSQVATNRTAFAAATQSLKDTREKIRIAKSKLQTHGPAASTINEILRGYLGHEEIQLVANDEGYQLVRRNSTEPKTLSEGEKTAIAFSHFLATLHSEGRTPQDFIVVLDDPISSLDARAMTHAVSLVQQRFNEPLQLFVLTHNLDFMREMKKWLDRRYKYDLAEFLFIQTGIEDGRRVSKLVKMPKLIREYESEYHYLYSLVKQLSDNPSDAEAFAYLLPNAMRKVLDIFLAFKVPGSSGLSSKVDTVLRKHDALNAARVKAMERLVQLESHSESIGDTTTFSAYTLEQISDAAKCLMQIIETLDPAHKKAMDKLCS